MELSCNKRTREGDVRPAANNWKFWFIEEGFIQKQRQRSSRLFGGQNLFLAALAVLDKDELKNKMNGNRMI